MEKKDKEHINIEVQQKIAVIQALTGRRLTITSLIAAVEQMIHKTIHLAQSDLSPKLTGVRWGTDTEEFIVYPANVTKIHQIHCLMHELSHSVFQDPSIDAKTLIRILHCVQNGEDLLALENLTFRHHYDKPSEYRAELFASTIVLETHIDKHEQLEDQRGMLEERLHKWMITIRGGNNE